MSKDAEEVIDALSQDAPDQQTPTIDMTMPFDDGIPVRVWAEPKEVIVTRLKPKKGNVPGVHICNYDPISKVLYRWEIPWVGSTNVPPSEFDGKRVFHVGINEYVVGVPTHDPEMKVPQIIGQAVEGIRAGTGFNWEAKVTHTAKFGSSNPAASKFKFAPYATSKHIDSGAEDEAGPSSGKKKKSKPVATQGVTKEVKALFTTQGSNDAPRFKIGGAEKLVEMETAPTETPATAIYSLGVNVPKGGGMTGRCDAVLFTVEDLFNRDPKTTRDPALKYLQIGAAVDFLFMLIENESRFTTRRYQFIEEVYSKYIAACNAGTLGNMSNRNTRFDMNRVPYQGNLVTGGEYSQARARETGTVSWNMWKVAAKVLGQTEPRDGNNFNKLINANLHRTVAIQALTQNGGRGASAMSTANSMLNNARNSLQVLKRAEEVGGPCDWYEAILYSIGHGPVNKSDNQSINSWMNATENAIETMSRFQEQVGDIMGYLYASKAAQMGYSTMQQSQESIDKMAGIASFMQTDGKRWFYMRFGANRNHFPMLSPHILTTAIEKVLSHIVRLKDSWDGKALACALVSYFDSWCEQAGTVGIPDQVMFAPSENDLCRQALLSGNAFKDGGIYQEHRKKMLREGQYEPSQNDCVLYPLVVPAGPSIAINYAQEELTFERYKEVLFTAHNGMESQEIKDDNYAKKVREYIDHGMKLSSTLDESYEILVGFAQEVNPKRVEMRTVEIQQGQPIYGIPDVVTGSDTIEAIRALRGYLAGNVY